MMIIKFYILILSILSIQTFARYNRLQRNTRDRAVDGFDFDQDYNLKKGALPYLHQSNQQRLKYKPKTTKQKVLYKFNRFLESVDWTDAIAMTLDDHKKNPGKYANLRKQRMVSDKFRGIDSKKLRVTSSIEQLYDKESKWGSVKKLFWRAFENFADKHFPFLEKKEEIPLFKAAFNAFKKTVLTP